MFKTVPEKGSLSLLVALTLVSFVAILFLTYIYIQNSGLSLNIFNSREAEASGPYGTQPGQPIDDKGNIMVTEAVANNLASSGAGWVRINFRLGPYPSDTAEFYSKYDVVIENLRSRGLQVLGLMSNESWHGSQSDWTANNWENTPGGDGYNQYIDQFCYAFQRIADHYEGKIKYWELWNEPNAWTSQTGPTTFSGGSFIYPSNFAAMLAQCHAQVHYFNNMDVAVISGGLFGHDLAGFWTGGAGADYLDKTYDIGINHTGKFSWAKSTYGSYPLDAVGQHIYINQFKDNGNINTTQFSNYLKYVNDVIKKWEGSGTNKKTWVSEFGWTTKDVTESQQASNLEKAFKILKTKPYVASALWFQLDDQPQGNLYFGLFRPDGSKKPSYSKFKTQTTFEGKKSSGSTVSKIADYYKNKGGLKAFGSPFDNGGSVWAHYWDFGYVQDFDGGYVGKMAIFDTGYRVQAGFWREYLNGENHSILKFPTSDEYNWNGGTRQDFQGGYMFWNPANNQITVTKN